MLVTSLARHHIFNDSRSLCCPKLVLADDKTFMSSPRAIPQFSSFADSRNNVGVACALHCNPMLYVCHCPSECFRPMSDLLLFFVCVMSPRILDKDVTID